MDKIYQQINAIVDKALPQVSNLSNASAVLAKLEDINWCGFYLVKGDTLYLGPFQGDVACTTIDKGRGVCGTAYKLKQTVIVDDVNAFPGHIACSPISKSEIVTPVIKNNRVVAVIDIDSPIYNRFGEAEKQLLESVADLLKDLF